MFASHHGGLVFALVKAIAAAGASLGFLVLLLDWSLGTTLFGLGLFIYGIYPGQNDYLKDLGMIGTLFGIVLLMCGPSVMKIAWFPILFLICAIPWPGLVYSWVAEPLQTMAANVAVDVLKLSGVDSVCSGTKIIIFSSTLAQPRVLNVAEACAGMRSLMTFISVGGAIAFLSSRPLWQKLLIVFSAIPIAIFCNVMRISGQGLLDHYVSPEWSESFAHQFVGMMMLLPAFFMILGVGLLLDKLFIEEAEEGDADFRASPTSVSAIATRQEMIPALGVVSGVGAPVQLPTAVTRPAPVSPAFAPQPAASSAKVAAPLPAKAPLRAVLPATSSVPPASPPVTQPMPPKPSIAIPPRPYTPANPRVTAPTNGTAVNGKSPAKAQPVRLPSPPVAGAERKPVDVPREPVRVPGNPTDSRRIPPSQPNALKPKESK